MTVRRKCCWCPPWTTICLMPTAKPKPSVYQLKITLLGIQPPIWRRIQVPSTIPLCCLHDAIQAVLGWTDSQHDSGADAVAGEASAVGARSTAHSTCVAVTDECAANCPRS